MTPFNVTVGVNVDVGVGVVPVTEDVLVCVGVNVDVGVGVVPVIEDVTVTVGVGGRVFVLVLVQDSGCDRSFADLGVRALGTPSLLPDDG